MFHPRTPRIDPEDTARAIDRLRRLIAGPARLLPAAASARSGPNPPGPADPGRPPGDPDDWSDLDDVPAPPIVRIESQQSGTDPNDDIPDVEVAPARLRRGHVVIIATVLLAAIVGASVLLLRSRPSTEPVARPSVHATMLATGRPIASSSREPAGFRRTSQGAAFLFVHVAGKVRRPGVVRLPVGARVYDALAAAGGPKAGVDLSTLNLARPLIDGEQVLVGVEQAPQARGSPQSQLGLPSPGPPELLDLNTATAEQLDLLPGVGPVLAERIIAARDQRGGFTAIEELREVSGIGERKYAELQSRVTTG